MTLQFYVELFESEPKIWRRIRVPYEYTFYKFHMAIQGAFGWENYHLFHFSKDGFLSKTSYVMPDDVDDIIGYRRLDARKAKIKLLFFKPNEEFVYIYDFGTKWVHRIVYETFTEEELERPYCVDGGGACPPEDCGGFGGYEEMIEKLQGENIEDQNEVIGFLGLVPGEKWDAHLCSIRETNKRLALL